MRDEFEIGTPGCLSKAQLNRSGERCDGIQNLSQFNIPFKDHRVLPNQCSVKYREGDLRPIVGMVRVPLVCKIQMGFANSAAQSEVGIRGKAVTENAMNQMDQYLQWTLSQTDPNLICQAVDHF
jgi:hypothetical protein